MTVAVSAAKASGRARARVIELSKAEMPRICRVHAREPLSPVEELTSLRLVRTLGGPVRQRCHISTKRIATRS
jgi:hypothetical protein